MKLNKKLFADKMQTQKLPELLISTFLSYYSTLENPENSYIFEDELSEVPIGSLPSQYELSKFKEHGESVINNTVIIKLNGGLGTSMGLNGPKCLLPVKSELSFFDITANQIRVMNKKFNTQVPLLLMNSFYTEDDTINQLNKYSDIKTNIPNTFIQNRYPKILQDNLKPASYPNNKNLEWNPPGHGDIYTSLFTTKVIDELIKNGIRYAFISNIDNLGASLDLSLLGYFAKKKLPFMMEVVERTDMDKKGGHIAKLTENGRLILRETAQCKNSEIKNFQDIKKYSYFNSNNIWLDLLALKKITENGRNSLKLPLIINKKNINPKDPTSDKVFQLETAIGSAISSFDNSEAIVISNRRFRPVKKWDNLIILWSDCFELTDSFELTINPKRTLPPISVTLDPKYYSMLPQIQERFRFGVPSLINCSSLEIKGDVSFGKNIIIKGDVKIINKSSNQYHIKNNTVIKNDVITPSVKYEASAL